MAEYPDVPSGSYWAIRDTIPEGTVLMCSGSARLSRVIQRATGSVFSHIAMLVWARDLDTLVVFESVESIGTWMTPLSQYVLDSRSSGRPYPGRLFLARHPDLATLTPEDWRRVKRFAFLRCGKLYNQRQIRLIGHYIANPFVDGPELPPDLREAKSFICSEAFGAVVQFCGFEPPWNERGYMAPSDFVPELEFFYEIDTSIPPPEGYVYA